MAIKCVGAGVPKMLRMLLFRVQGQALISLFLWAMFIEHPHFVSFVSPRHTHTAHMTRPDLA
jgi:hypothetical protein